MLPVAEKYDFNLLLPEFRGNNRLTNPCCTKACGSHFAKSDIKNAMDYVLQNEMADEENVFLIGLSGGGHMALLMAGFCPEYFKAVGAYVPITAVLLPQFTRMLKKGNDREAVDLWASATELSFAIIGLVAAGVFTYAEEVMSLLYSEKYLPGLSVFRIYTLVLLLRCTYFGIILNAKGKTKEIFYGGVASLIFNAVLNPLLYWLMGMNGPALATFLSMSVVLLWQLYRTAKCTGITFSQVFPWKRIGNFLRFKICIAVGSPDF